MLFFNKMDDKFEEIWNNMNKHFRKMSTRNILETKILILIQ